MKCRDGKNRRGKRDRKLTREVKKTEEQEN